MGAYIAGFACVEHRVVVEIDGGQHADRVHADAERTRELTEQGWRVIRFWNDDVILRTEMVLEEIVRAVTAHPHP